MCEWRKPPTDPNLDAFRQFDRVTDHAIRHHPQPVDATRVPELAGFRKIFSAFHHFRPEQARAVLADAVRKREGIAFFEATQRSTLAMSLMLLVGL